VEGKENWWVLPTICEESPTSLSGAGGLLDLRRRDLARGVGRKGGKSKRNAGTGWRRREDAASTFTEGCVKLLRKSGIGSQAPRGPWRFVIEKIVSFRFRRGKNACFSGKERGKKTGSHAGKKGGERGQILILGTEGRLLLRRKKKSDRDRMYAAVRPWEKAGSVEVRGGSDSSEERKGFREVEGES